MNDLYEQLHWLPLPPENINAVIKQAEGAKELRQIASYRLDENQLYKLANRKSKLHTSGVDLSPLKKMTLGIVSNTTSKMIRSPLIATALRFGIDLEVVETEYNQVAQIAFAGDSIFYGKNLDGILLAIDYHGLPLTQAVGDTEVAHQSLQQAMTYIKSVVDGIRSQSQARIFLQNIVPPAESHLGSIERALAGTIPWYIARLNLEIDAMITSEICLVDVNSLAANIGLTRWNDPTLWNLAKLPFAQDFLPVYCDYIARILGSKIGQSRRCLILDLDNTVWGGIIGDDGIEGIRIGQGDPTGEAHLAVQETALNLRKFGIVLAVSSKNDDEISRKPFREHPDMLLKEDHIAVFQANWTDKATNIRTIANTLSLGLQSMVFLDDNPAERMLVRKELPEVAVPELPGDPALYVRTLLAGGYFEATSFSDEDKLRASMYQQNAKRVELLSQSTDMNAYLSSLEMQLTVAPFNAQGRSRISQLINKSNQFNLTSKRYSEADIEAFENDPSIFTVQARLLDALGDNGMISVVICRKQKEYWEIDSWLMSCRVLGRSVENAILDYLAQSAIKEGAKELRGAYIPTDRNGLVKDHYRKLGFEPSSHNEKTETWVLALDRRRTFDVPIAVRTE